MKLANWGFSPTFAAPLSEQEIYARVIEEQKTTYALVTEQGEVAGQLAGKLLQPTVDRLDRPVVGDWVAARPLWNEQKAVIQRVLPRLSLLKRKAAGQEEQIQPLAANVDCTLIVTSLNRDFNPKRLDRYLTVAHESGSQAVVLLTKKDLAPDSDQVATELEARIQVPCLALSALDPKEVERVRLLLQPQKTYVFVGSSGVGKSTLVNALLGREEQHTGAVREGDDRGRHTTTSRRLLPLPNGALVIDTPGMREIQLESDHEAGLSASFARIGELARLCRFSNCAHLSEPGCAVKAAVDSQEIAREELESYLKLSRETASRQPKQGPGKGRKRR